VYVPATDTERQALLLPVTGKTACVPILLILLIPVKAHV
jgi:hypothetical protein